MNLSFVSRKPSVWVAAFIAVELAWAPLTGAIELPHLDITRTNPGVRLSWTNAAVALETSLTVTGAWLEVTGAPNPYLIPATNTAMFFRLRANGFDYRYLAPTFTTAIGD